MNHSPQSPRAFFTALAVCTLLLTMAAVVQAVEPGDSRSFRQSTTTAGICAEDGSAQLPSWCTSAQTVTQDPHSVPEPAPLTLISIGIASFSLATLWRRRRRR